jgi:hypothetical protein
LKNWVVLVVVEAAQIFDTVTERNGLGNGRSDGFGQFAACHIVSGSSVGSCADDESPEETTSKLAG